VTTSKEISLECQHNLNGSLVGRKVSLQ